MADERVQRRLAAILAADVVGYSRLMGEDEAGTVARLKSVHAELIEPKVAEYGGRIVKTTGDGVLIEFPSAVDAVQHAVDVQYELVGRNADLPEGQRLEFRIGINIGDVIEPLEQALGKPVVSSNICTFWSSLRAAGIEDRIEGYGRLLREH